MPIDMPLCAYEPAGTVDVDPANRPIIDKMTRHTLATEKLRGLTDQPRRRLEAAHHECSFGMQEHLC